MKFTANIAPESFERTATRVTVVTMGVNVALAVFKLLAGFLAHSSAMVGDGVHSASDVLSGAIVLVGVKLSARDADKEHPYGHERFECVAAVVLAAALAMTGLAIGFSAVKSLQGTEAAPVPGLLALAAAAVSILCKETMYWYTRAQAKRLNSTALMANAWHHRSDALSSVGALVGIAGARMGLPVMEKIASLVICGFILRAAYDILRDALEKMVDHACDQATEEALRTQVLSEPQVLGIDSLQTRQFGSRVYVDLEIRLDGNLTLYESHAVAERVHDKIETAFPQVKHIMIHVNPDEKT